VATETEKQIYAERFGNLWRWSLVHARGPYPLLRISARFLKMDYAAIYIGYRQVDALGVSTRDPDEVINPDGWAVLTFAEPEPEDRVVVQMVEVVG